MEVPKATPFVDLENIGVGSPLCPTSILNFDHLNATTPTDWLYQSSKCTLVSLKYLLTFIKLLIKFALCFVDLHQILGAKPKSY